MSYRILACHGTSFESRGIQFLTGPRSHIRIQTLHDVKGMTAHYEPIFVPAGGCFEAWNSGVRVVPSWDTDYAKGTIIEAFSLREPLNEMQLAVGDRFLCRQVGKPYNWPGCLRLALPPGARPRPIYADLRPWNYDHLFCSEYAAGLFVVMDLPLFNGQPPYEVTPQELPESVVFNPKAEILTV